MRKINEIIVHCTATRAGWWPNAKTSAKVDEVRKWHLARGWRDIGYHYLIDRDGTIAKGRPIEQTGAHVKGRNTGTIGIALFGGHGSSENDKFSDNFTPEQDAALRGLIADLRGKFGNMPVTGHNQYAAKACPGFQVKAWLDHKPPRESIAQSTTLQATAGTATAGIGGVATSISYLDGTAQLIVIGTAVFAALGLAWIARERIKKWAQGIH